MSEGKIHPNFTDLVQLSSQSGTPEIIDLKDACFTPDIEEVPRKTPRHELIIVLKAENKYNMLFPSPLKPNKN